MHTYIFQNYQITLKYKDGSKSYAVAERSNQTQYTAKYLKFSTTYTFEVQTMFKDNTSSDPVSIHKTIGPFSAPVGPLKPVVYADDSVTLFWSAPPTIDPSKVTVRSRFLFVCVLKQFSNDVRK